MKLAEGFGCGWFWLQVVDSAFWSQRREWTATPLISAPSWNLIQQCLAIQRGRTLWLLISGWELIDPVIVITLFELFWIVGVELDLLLIIFKISDVTSYVRMYVRPGWKKPIGVKKIDWGQKNGLKHLIGREGPRLGSNIRVFSLYIWFSNITCRRTNETMETNHPNPAGSVLLKSRKTAFQICSS